MWKRSGITSIAFGALVVAAACRAETTELEPVATVGGEDIAQWEGEGVNVAVRADRWPGREAVRREITPLWVSVENDSQKPVAVRYKSMRIRTGDGTSYQALPPWKVEGGVEQAYLGADYDPIPEPGFDYGGFEVAPYYSVVYPSIDPYDGVYEWDATFYEESYGYWAERDLDLPTELMLERAIPEGVVHPGGRVSGFVYFEHVPAEPDIVHFDANLRNPETREVFVEPSIDLVTLG